MKQAIALFVLLSTLTSQSNYLMAQISGTVFRDYNNNGSRQTSAPNEPLASSVIINAYNSNDIIVASFTSAGTTSPNYSIPALGTTYTGTPGSNTGFVANGTPVRLEFVIPSNFGNGGATVNGTTSATSVRFITAGAAAVNINFGISNNKEQYNATVPLAIPRHVYRNFTGASDYSLKFAPYNYLADLDGNINTGGANVWNVTNGGPLGTPNNGTGAPTDGQRPAPTNLALNNQIGTTYGLAFSTGTRRLFVSSYLRRKGYLTSNGLGAIWVLNNPTGPVTPSLYVDLNSVFSNAFGTNPRTGAGSPPAPVSGWDDDREIIPTVHRRGIGDIDINNTEDTIYAINLANRRLYAVPTSGTLNSTTIKNYDFLSGISSLTGVLSFTNADIRPFGIGTNPRNNLIYIGAVYTAETSQSQTDVRALVWTFNPASGAFTLVLNQSLNYNRSGGDVNTNSGQKLQPWKNLVCEGNIATCSGAGQQSVSDPQPILSDIRFDGDVMVLGFRDRYIDLTPNATAGANAAGEPYTRGYGEILRAHLNAGSYILESNGSSVDGNTGVLINSGVNTGGAGGIANGGGPGGGEFYFQDWTGDAGAYEASQGALFVNPGVQEVVTTSYDAVSVGSNGNKTQNHYNTGGFSKYSNVNGRQTGNYDIYETNDAHTFAKANGLGDIEPLYNALPIEIGNRIWNDTNGDGIQTAGENAIANVTVELYSNGADGIPGNGDDVLLGTTTTNASGEWYFNTANVTDGDPTTAGNQAGPQPNFNYNIRIGSADWTSGAGTGDLAGLGLTRTDKIGNGAADLSDNDGALNSNNVPMITLTTGAAGVNNHNLDFGFKALASLGDKVWRDDDKDGIQDSGEPGVAGVTVTLYNNSGVAIATTITDAYGNYLFDNLAAGTYQVGFTPPANYSFTTQTNNNDNTTLTGGSTAANGSDVNATTGRTANVVLSAGENERNIDAGLIFNQPATNSIGDRVWFDTDGDGVQDANEAGVSGVTVTLYTADGVTVIATTVTDANGNYTFTGLAANTNYVVGITPPVGMALATGGTTTTGNATTNSDFNQATFKTTAFSSGPAGTQITGIDAGLVNQPASTASLGDRVWNDLNNNGIQDAGEPGVAGVTVNLYRDANGDGVINGAEASTPYLTTTTDAFGNYIFNNLPATAGTGTLYQAGFVLPGGYSFVSHNAGSDDFADSDANTIAGGFTGFYTLKQGQRNMSVDAGITQNTPAGTARLGNRVWYDADQDGVQDAGEANVSGVTVTLYQNGPDGLPGTNDDVVIGTTTTDANGNYLFANLAASSGASTEYNVGFSNLPQGYSFTPVWSSNDANATNSDANPATGRTGSINLSAGENEPDVDAGLIAGVPSGLGSIGNKVWWDLDNDNIQDSGEPGVAGVTVTLLDAGPDGILGNGDDGPSRTTTTNALGEYIFSGLPAGNYAVRFSMLPAGATAVTQNSGADDTVDSDGGAISGGNSTTAVYTLAAGEDNLTIDLGIRNTARGSFGNRVWLDNGAGGGTANDGIQNGTEAGVGGVMVTLVNAAGQPVDRSGTVTTTPITTVTDADGYYSFADLAPTVSFAALFSNIPSGFNFTTKSGTGTGDDNRSDADLTSGLTPAVTIVANTHNTTLDAGINSSRAALGNYVWMDNDGDGVQDSGEPGVPGVTVTLYRPGFGLDGIAGNADDALPVASMITDQSGGYMFNNLVPGTYEVEFSTIPGGTVFTQRNTPGDNSNNTNSDAVPVSGNTSVARTAGITLTAGEVDLTIDAGLFKPRAVIGNYVWVDSNNNGVQDPGEPAAPGITVSLIDAGGNVVAVAVTDANGQYLFPNVAPGTYSLSFANLPAGAGFTSSNVGDDNFDSDVVGTTITSIVVTTTTVNLSYDAGITGLVTLPVNLVLTAVKQGNQALLTWQVSAERDVLSYTLQRSGNSTVYNDIYTVNSDGRTVYTKIDEQPVNGINYYRIKVTNLDGSIEYSQLRIVRFAGSGAISIFPNPATDKVNIQLPDSWQQESVNIEIISKSGQVVISKAQSGSNQVQSVDISNLPSGAYLIRISNKKGEVEIRKLNVL